MDREQYAVPVRWMIEDVGKAIEGGANFLAALGLLAYTEALGREVLRAEGTPYPRNEDSFLRCAKMMGYPVDVLRNAKAYDAFRNGLAHDYYIKGNRAIVATDFADGEDPNDDRCGLQLSSDGSPTAIVLRAYLRDFRRAAQSWIRQREAHWSGSASLPSGGFLPTVPTDATSAGWYPPPKKETP